MVVLLELTSFQYEDLVRVNDCVQSVGNCNYSAVSERSVHCLVDNAFRSDVNVGCGFIDQHNPRRLENSTSDADELPFSDTEVLSVFGDLNRMMYTSVRSPFLSAIVSRSAHSSRALFRSSSLYSFKGSKF